MTPSSCKFGNNKEIEKYNTEMIKAFREENKDKIETIPLSSISLKEATHVKEKANYYRSIFENRLSGNESPIVNPLIVKKDGENDYRLILGFKNYVIANKLNQKMVNVIVVNKNRTNFVIRDVGCIWYYDVIEIDSLIVPQLFTNHSVNETKLKKIKEYYDKHGCLDQPITISTYNVITDGYARYVFAKSIGLEKVECRIVNSDNSVSDPPMPKHIWNEETEKQDVINSLNCLKEFLDKRDSWQNPHKYIIAENFPIGEGDDYVPNVYELVNLKIDAIEDGIVIFDDGEGILEEKMYDDIDLPLHSPIIDNILYIGFQSMENKITISLSTGYIQIYY